MPASRHHGHIDGIAVGDLFGDRIALANAGLHRATQAGITGWGDGTESIVLNAGYVDDIDHGGEVIYTGHGGRDISNCLGSLPVARVGAASPVGGVDSA